MTFSPTAFPGPLQRGARDTNPSGHVHRLQGWLSLWSYYTGPIDGIWGPDTDNAFFRWRLEERGWLHEHNRLPLTEAEWASLTAPLARALDTLPVRAIAHTLRERGGDLSIGDAVAAVARQWLAQSVGGGPLRELPGNSGPVVEACTRWLAERDRLPCFGGHAAHVGSCYTFECRCSDYAPDWRKAWCAAWDSTILKQACESLGVPMPIKGSLGCDELWLQAQRSEAVDCVRGEQVPGRLIRQGDLFLVRGDKPGDWTHCGVVLEVVGGMVRGSSSLQAPFIRTAEGNTTNDGRRNGDRLLERVRPLTGLDFICWRSA